MPHPCSKYKIPASSPPVLSCILRTFLFTLIQITFFSSAPTLWLSHFLLTLTSSPLPLRFQARAISHVIRPWSYTGKARFNAMYLQWKPWNWNRFLSQIFLSPVSVIPSMLHIYSRTTEPTQSQQLISSLKRYTHTHTHTHSFIHSFIHSQFPLTDSYSRLNSHPVIS